jgi:hypothetical protein
MTPERQWMPLKGQRSGIGVYIGKNSQVREARAAKG